MAVEAAMLPVDLMATVSADSADDEDSSGTATLAAFVMESTAVVRKSNVKRGRGRAVAAVRAAKRLFISAID